MSTITWKIGDISDQIRGVTYRKQDAVKTKIEGFVPILRAGNITDEGLAYEDLVYVPAARVSAKQKVRKNDILIAASSGSLDVVGKAAQALEDFEGGFGAFCKVLRPNKEVDTAYFAQYFKTPYYRRRVSFLAAGANINNLRNEDLDGLEIPLPPLEEQRRIAKILDAADALRAKRRESLALLDKLIQSTFLDMFGDPVTNPMGWEDSTLGQECDEIKNGRSIKQKQDAGGIPISRIETISDGVVNPGKVGYAGLELRNAEKDLLRHGDILFSHINSTQHLCKCALYLDLHGPLIHGMNLLRFRVGKRLFPLFLLYLMKNTNYRSTLMRHENPAVNQSSIAAGKLKTHMVLVPPLPLQQRFASIVEAIEKQKTRLKAHLSELDTLFASLQSRAFQGEL